MAEGLLAWLEKETSVNLSLVGGKAASLIKLVAIDVPVPEAFCFTTQAYDTFIATNGLSELISSFSSLLSSSDLAELERISDEISVAFQKASLPPALEGELSEAYFKLSRQDDGSLAPVAVRSSATTEDLTEASFAGQHDTFLNVRGLAGLVEAVMKCWASLWSVRAIHYRSSKGIDHISARMAVVVQRMVDAEVSAVTFTANPVTGRKDQLLVNLTWGLGEAIVSGLVTPDSYLLGKDPLMVLEASIEEKSVMVVYDGEGGTKEVEVAEADRFEPCMKDDAVLANAELCLEIEKRFGYPVDVESAFSQRRWYILQARPITA